jgi:hypothetical protein
MYTVAMSSALTEAYLGREFTHRSKYGAGCIVRC